jgi:PAS domain S-box-containing protein
VALYQTTPEGRLVNANSAYLELVGAASLAELKDWNVTAGYLDPGERAVWCRDLEAQGEIHRETQWLRRDGTPFWVDERARVRRDAQGFLSYDGSALDITERKLAEAEGATLRARLLHSEKFEAIGHLAGGVAHDFNNQLTAIMGFGETLEETLENEQQKRFVRNIMRACQRSADLTRKLLAFARKGIVLSEPVDMHEIIREVVGLLKHSLDKRITLQTRCGASRRVVMGDPTQLQNALMNLAINARDAMPEGGTLAFETSVLTLDEDYCRAMPYEIEPGVYLQLVVADSGVGMAAETLDHIFEPFFTTKELGKGTGLGLASVYGTIKQHNGYIQAQSALDQGSRFNIFLPLSDVPMAKPIPPTPLEPHRGSGHILFVDDEALVAEVASEILTNLKYQVTLCRDGQEAVEFYATAWEAVDLVILDMVMPRMGGKDTFHALRQINPGVKVLIVSGFSIEGEAQQLLNAGALGFLQKPYRSVELVKEVAKALGRT